MSPALITMAEYARRRGVSRKSVTMWVQRGRISTVERDGKRLIDPIAADRALASTAQVAATVAALVADDPTEARGGGGEGLTALKAATEAERGALLRLERLELEGKLVRRDQVEAEHKEAARRVRRALDGLPSIAEDVVGIVAGGGGVIEVRRRIKDFARSIETGLATSLAEAAAEIERQRAGIDDDHDDDEVAS